jgi:hypothetical protein
MAVRGLCGSPGGVRVHSGPKFTVAEAIHTEGHPGCGKLQRESQCDLLAPCSRKSMLIQSFVTFGEGSIACDRDMHPSAHKIADICISGITLLDAPKQAFDIYLTRVK